MLPLHSHYFADFWVWIPKYAHNVKPQVRDTSSECCTSKLLLFFHQSERQPMCVRLTFYCLHYCVFSCAMMVKEEIFFIWQSLPLMASCAPISHAHKSSSTFVGPAMCIHLKEVWAWREAEPAMCLNSELLLLLKLQSILSACRWKIVSPWCNKTKVWWFIFLLIIGKKFLFISLVNWESNKTH